MKRTTHLAIKITAPQSIIVGGIIMYFLITKIFEYFKIYNLLLDFPVFPQEIYAWVFRVLILLIIASILDSVLLIQLPIIALAVASHNKKKEAY